MLRNDFDANRSTGYLCGATINNFEQVRQTAKYVYLPKTCYDVKSHLELASYKYVSLKSVDWS